MIFGTQRFLEDHFARRNLSDADQYAVSLANLYGQRRALTTAAEFRKAMSRIRTVFFRSNNVASRSEFEADLLAILDTKFEKKNPNSAERNFPGGVADARRRLSRQRRLTISTVLAEFKAAVEARGIDAFWDSRSRGELRSKPEVIGQTQLALFLRGVLRDRGGLVLREMASGVGWVDVSVVFSAVLHLLELKVVKRARLDGVEQLDAYMQTERRKEGWLVVFDASAKRPRAEIPTGVATDAGLVRILVIDINPLPPSRRRALR